ncbi:hypothetical protein Tco_1362621 [Tanacetum coccineum]
MDDTKITTVGTILIKIGEDDGNILKRMRWMIPMDKRPRRMLNGRTKLQRESKRIICESVSANATVSEYSMNAINVFGVFILPQSVPGNDINEVDLTHGVGEVDLTHDVGELCHIAFIPCLNMASDKVCSILLLFLFTPRFLLIMSGIEPGEMASERLRAVGMPKFHMHIYTSELTTKELKEVITEYCIPKDLHPHLPPPNLKQNQQSFKEMHQGGYVEFKGLEEEIVFDRQEGRAEAMSWRHIDTDVQDDILDHYKEVDVLVDIQSCLIQSKTLMERLPIWLGTVKAIEKPDAKVVTAREKKDRQNLAKAQVKRTGGSSLAAPRKKQAHKNKESGSFGSKKTILVTPLHHAAPNPADETTGSVPKNADETVTGGPQTANHKNEVVNLSKNTRIPTPLVTVV